MRTSLIATLPLALLILAAAALGAGPLTAIKAGKVIDPSTGSSAARPMDPG